MCMFVVIVPLVSSNLVLAVVWQSYQQADNDYKAMYGARDEGDEIDASAAALQEREEEDFRDSLEFFKLDLKSLTVDPMLMFRKSENYLRTKNSLSALNGSPPPGGALADATAVEMKQGPVEEPVEDGETKRGRVQGKWSQAKEQVSTTNQIEQEIYENIAKQVPLAPALLLPDPPPTCPRAHHGCFECTACRG